MCASRIGYGNQIVTDNLIFGYDANDQISRFYKGEPTTNIALNPEFINLTSWSLTRYPSGTNGSLDGAFWMGDNVKMVHQSGYSNSQTFLIQSISLTVGLTYTASVWCYALDTASVLDIYNGAGWNSIYCTTYNQWVKLSVSFTVGGTGAVQLRCGIYTTLDRTSYFKNFQCELKSHSTQFTSNNRTNTTSLIDITGNSVIDLSNMSFDSTAHPYFNVANNNYINLGSSTLFDSIDKITIDAWVKITSFVNYNTIVWKCYENNTAVTAECYGLCTEGSNKFRFSSFAQIVTSNTIATVDKWYNVVATYDRAYIKIYVNGIFENQTAKTDAIRVSSFPLTIGCRYNTGVFYAENGYISTVKIYNTSLSASEILQNFNSLSPRFGF